MQELEEAKRRVAAEVEQAGQVLDASRSEQQQKLADFSVQNEARKSLYEEELRQLRATISNEKSEIDVSIHQIDYMTGDNPEDVTPLVRSYDLREEIIRDQEESLAARAQLTNRTATLPA
jgi:hypothetical protein